MAPRRLAPADLQPKAFSFTAENRGWARKEITKYPEGRQASAVIPILWRAQQQSGGWTPEAAIRYVAEFLDMAPIRVLEIATFYTMFNLEPVGQFHVQLCGTTPCMLRGADGLKEACKRMIGEEHHVSADGKFSWIEVECLGACVNAPAVQINDDFYEDLAPDTFARVLNELAAGRQPKPGPQINRQFSAPVGGPTTLRNGSSPGTARHQGEPIEDESAKKPGEAANVRESPVPKPPVADSSDPRQ